MTNSVFEFFQYLLASFDGLFCVAAKVFYTNSQVDHIFREISKTFH